MAGGLLKSVLGAASGLNPVTTGLSVAGQIFGAIKGAQQNKANQNLLNKKQEENKAQYDLNANQSFLDTAAAKDAVKANKDAMIEGQKAVAGRAAITGASDEAVVAGQTGVQKSYNDAISRLAGAGTQFQQNERRMYNARKDALDSQQMVLNNQKAESASNLVQNAGDLMGSQVFGQGMNDTPKFQTGMQARTAGQTNALNKIAKSVL